MKFKKYNEIENSYRKLFIEKIKEQGQDYGEFVVTEKAHGSNHAIWYNGKQFRSAKRSGWLVGEDGSFYNYEKILEKHKEKIKALYNQLKENKAEFDNLIIFGELFGGMYNHPDVKKVNDAIKVQKGIQYSPDNEFYVYDIMLDYEYINYDMVCEICEEFGFLYAKPLFKGTMDECLEYPNEFPTTIPEMLGLPLIEGNNCEGVVIKPNDARFMGHNRVIIKNKNEKWKEKEKIKKVKKEIKLSEEANNLIEEILSYITENRLKNVLSKHGKVKQKDFGLLMKLFTTDILDDFKKDFGDEFMKIDKEERKHVTKRMSGESANLIRENFLNILDEMF